MCRCETPAHQTDDVQPTGSRTSFRFQLLIPVNIVLLAIAALMLGYDAQHEQTRRLAEKDIALNEEAKTLLPALNQIRHQGRSHVQQYVDAVCGQMRESESPGHHIVVELGDDALQALTAAGPTATLLRAMHEASESPTHTAIHDGSEVLVGMHTVDDTTVFVSETVTNVQKSAMDNAVWRLAAFAALQLLGAILINACLLRIVVRPLSELVRTVDAVANGEYGLLAGSFHSSELESLANAINVMSVELALRERDQRHDGSPTESNAPHENSGT